MAAGHRWFGWFTNRGLRFKILVAILVVGAAGGLVGIVSIVEFGRLNNRVTEISEHGVVPVEQLAAVRRAVLQTRIDALADEYLGTDEEHRAYLADLDTVDRAFAAYTSSNDATGVLAGYRSAFTAAWGRYREVVGGPLLALARSGNMSAYVQLRDAQVKPAAAGFNDALSGLERT
jgi:methyl-accepting chemotaxis protein